MKLKMPTVSRIFLAAGWGAAVLSLGACNNADTEIAWSVVESFLAVNDIYSPGSQGFNVAGLVGALGSETSNEITNSDEAVALNGLDVILQIEEADAIAAEALLFQNINTIEQAIDLRPKDWNYREDAVAIALSQGLYEEAGEHSKQSDALLREAIADGGDCFALKRNQLRHRADAARQQMELTDPDSEEYSKLRLVANGAVEEMNTLGAENSFCTFQE